VLDHSAATHLDVHQDLGEQMTHSVLGQAIPQLPSGDVAVTEKFFNSVLGFETIDVFPELGLLMVRRGDAEIHFWQTPTADEAKRLGRNSSCYIRVTHIEQIFEEYKANRVPFRYELEKKEWGMLEMQIDDPYGNAIRFGEALQ
jgi:uncharacterized glyoxalase superfamily protein PhnB